MIRWIWEVVVVIAATLAVVTNAVLIGTNVDNAHQLQRIQSDVNALHNRMTEYENYNALVERKMLELQAQVMFGLHEKYDIVEE